MRAVAPSVTNTSSRSTRSGSYEARCNRPRRSYLSPLLLLAIAGLLISCGDIAAPSDGSATVANTTPPVTPPTTPSDVDQPTTPTGLSATAVGSTVVNLSWSASTDNVGVTGYIVRRDGVQVATPTSTIYSDTGLSASTAYSYTVAARDAAGNASPDSSSQSATTGAPPAPDAIPPSLPTNLVATPGINAIGLTWSASTDNVAVTGYIVRRNGTAVVTSAVTTYGDTGLASGTSYSYTVSAVDAAGNASAQTAPVAATTAAAPPPDTIPPSVPANLVATPGTNAISLTWSASTDNVAVTGYTVRRDGTPVVTSAATNYVDTGLTVSTAYSYTLSAVDAAVNESAQTAPVAATTLATGTSTPLAQLAASMQPGQWANFTMGNFNFALVDAGGGHSILEFASRGHWDPVHKKIQFWGQGHNAGQALITYNDATNTWTRDTTVANSNIGHGYQHVALNPANGDLYMRIYGQGTIRRKPYGQAWQDVAPFDNSVNNQVAGALEWVPQLNGGAGGLAFADTGGVRFSNAAVTSWGSQANGASGPYHQNGVAISGAFYFGGGNGSSDFWRLNANGTVTDVADSPVNFGVTAMHLIPHPNGVDALLIGPGTAGNTYRYNTVANTWSNLGAHQLNSGVWWVGVTVPEYGVTVWLCQDTSVSTPFVRVFKP